MFIYFHFFNKIVCFYYYEYSSSLKNPQKYLRGLSSITIVTYNPIAMTPIMMTNNGILTFLLISYFRK